MVGMLQIITYLLALYLVMKGVEILQIGLASPRESRAGVVGIGFLSLVVCGIGAYYFVQLQDRQAVVLQLSVPRF